MSEKLCELKIKFQSDVLKLTEALTNSGYDVQVSPVFYEFPKHGIDYFALRIGERRACDGTVR